MTEQAPDSQPSTATHDTDLLQAVNNLAGDVRGLTTELTVSKEQNSRQRKQFWAIVALFVLFIGGGYVYADRLSDSIKDNTASAKQQCENSNGVREANIVLWSTIISLSSMNPDKPQTPQQAAATKALLDWIEQLYRPHDCNDLSKVYDTPAPPDFTQYIVSGNGS